MFKKGSDSLSYLEARLAANRPLNGVKTIRRVRPDKEDEKDNRGKCLRKKRTEGGLPDF